MAVDKKKRLHAPTVTFLRAYNFGAKEKDPIIDRIRTIFDDEGISIYDSHKSGGPSVAAMHNWFEGDTRRPQYATICAALRSAGYDFVVQKVDRAEGKTTGDKTWTAAMPKIAKQISGWVRERS